MPKGEYDAVIKSAVEKNSKKGNPMIEATFTVFGEGGTEVEIRDWLLSGDMGQRKLQRFCKSADLWDTYQAGELCADSCTDLNVRVKVIIEESDEYGPRNKIADYVPRKAAVTPEPTKAALQGVPAEQRARGGSGRKDPTAPPTGDDIPF